MNLVDLHAHLLHEVFGFKFFDMQQLGHFVSREILPETSRSLLVSRRHLCIRYSRRDHSPCVIESVDRLT